MTHKGLLELCYYSKMGGLLGADPESGEISAYVRGPHSADSFPREVRAYCVAFDGAWTHDLRQRDSFAWWSEILPAAREWLFGLNWIIGVPKSALMLLADDQNPYVG